ncbi:hypothetical protein LUZ60_007639 [Juncus effusus]|nr:hypothetical protein LUZ60_007639 [Juncus effusus]
MASESNEAPKLKLYNYWRSSCSQRVRIALKLKGLDYEYKAVDLFKAEQFTPEFEKINPLGFVPALVDGDMIIADSFAIILYLDEKYPQHPLLPKDLKEKTFNIQIASIVSSSIQPLQNIPVIDFVKGRFDSHEKILWAQHHINKGFTALEKMLKDCAGKYATGDEIQIGDLFLEPQIHAGLTRFQIDMTNYPTLARLHEAYMQIPAFQAAIPEIQPDAPKAS